MSATNGREPFAPRAGFIPGVEVNLGGHKFVLAPLGLGLVRQFQEQAKAMASKVPPPTEDEWTDFNIAAIVASLQRNYPEMTRDEIEGLLDANYGEIATLAINQAGLKKVTPGELPPVR
jgi:hypothetical protein